jgi:hypothetical protein
VEQAADKDVQIAGDTGTAITVRFNTAAHKRVAVILTFRVIKVTLFRLNSAECGVKVMHHMHLLQDQGQTLEPTGANGVAD